MPTLKGLTLCCFLCLALCCLLSLNSPLALTSRPIQAAPPQGEPIIQALLNEVHQLRLAIQQNTLNTSRAQITIEHLRAQQTRVDGLSLTLEGIRKQIAAAKLAQSRMTEQLKEWENQLSQEPDASRRVEIERQYRDVKTSLERQTQIEQQQREREAQVMTQLQVEQAKLGDLTDRLEALERGLAAQQLGDRPQPDSRRP